MSKRKKGNKNSNRPTALIALVLILIGTNAATIYYFMFYQQTIPLEDVPQNIGDITENPATIIGHVVTITGYYIIAAGFPMLVEDTLLFLNNSLQPNNYVWITGEPPVEMKDYLGMRCDVKGMAEWGDESQEILGVRYSRYTPHARDVVNQGIYEDKVLDASVLEGLGLPEVSPIAQKYALLYSGGWQEDKAYYRFWNDLVFMYAILKMHGYPEENIYVIYKDGVGEYENATVNYPATQTAMESRRNTRTFNVPPKWWRPMAE